MLVNTQTLVKKAPRLLVLNAKGGVGKTAIALNISLTFGYGFITNDRLSIVDDVLPNKRCIILNQKDKLPEVHAGWPIVYDFGGYPDARAVKVIEKVQYVLIPILAYRENIQASLNFIQEITHHKDEKRILIVINQTSGNQYDVIKKAIHTYFPSIKTFNLKKTAAFAWMVEHKKSLRELSLNFKQHSRHFKQPAGQFDKIFEHIIEGI